MLATQSASATTSLVKLRKLGERLQAFRADFTSKCDDIELRLEHLSAAESRRADPDGTGNTPSRWPLERDEYIRYSRQLILPQIGLHGQLRLKAASVLLVGAGGLGCPAAAYLAGSGVGRLGIVDGDTVEVSNLHRQTVHSIGGIGEYKAESIAGHVRRRNPNVKITVYNEHISPTNALSIISSHDIVLDCTDNPASRYLISDVCILKRKLLVSASALRTEGQLMVLNNPPAISGGTGGPCYRCVFPRPPPPEAILSCGEGGILGPVVGVMGVLQALEAIKLITSAPDAPTTQDPPRTEMLMFSAYNQAQPFRKVRLRGRRPDCASCSANATITQETITSGSLDYVQFCGGRAAVPVLGSHERLTATELAGELKGSGVMLLDVREQVEHELCSLPRSTSVPFSAIESWTRGDDVPDDLKRSLREAAHVRVICKLGNDSQMAVRKLQELHLFDANHRGTLRDVSGGLRAWRLEVDPDWPEY